MSKALGPDSIPNLKFQLKVALQSGAHKIAAFDADGTLWDTDIGHNFIHYQIEKKLLKNLPDGAWEKYLKWHIDEPEAAYLWLAQVNKGVSLSLVRQWAREALAASGDLPKFKHMAELIDGLRDLGVNVYVVTASVKWAVEPAAEMLGIPFENVLGIETEVDGGIITDIQKGAITYRAGKAKALQEKTKGRRPMLAAGNSLGDLELISTATHFPVAHVKVGQDHENYKTERDLLEFAKQRGWFYFDLMGR